MTWGIIAALPQELSLILSAMDVDQIQTAYGVKFYVGRISEKSVVAVCSSIGTINAAVCTSVLIREMGATAVVNVGVAGSTCKDLSVLDVVLGAEVVFHDADLDFIKEYYPFRSSFSADTSLLAQAKQAIARMGKDFMYKAGIIATGDSFVDDSAVKNDIINRCGCLCVEMEGAAVGQVAYMSGVPFLIIRTLSDNAEENAIEKYENLLEKAAEISAGIVLEMIQSL